MRKKALYIVAVLTLLITTACNSNPKIKNGEEVVAKINGKEYTADELYEELKGQYGYNTIINWIDGTIAENEVETTDEINAYVDEAIEFYSYYAESYGMTLPNFAASYLGLSGIESEDDLREYILKDRKLTIAIQNQVASKVKASEVESFYNENYKTVYTYRDILITNDDDAKDKIEEIKKALKDKKGDDLIEEFTSLAKKYSTDTNASDGGLVESATKNKVDEDVWKKLADLDDKEYSGDAIETDAGYHIILRISKDKAKDLDDVKEEIKVSIAQSQLEVDQYLSYDILTELRNKYKITFFDKDLKENYNDYLEELENVKKTAAESNSNTEKEDD